MTTGLTTELILKQNSKHFWRSVSYDQRLVFSKCCTDTSESSGVFQHAEHQDTHSEFSWQL